MLISIDIQLSLARRCYFWAAAVDVIFFVFFMAAVNT